MELGLKGKVAIITGASDGLGAAAAARLASLGVGVAICSRGRERLDEVSGAIRAAGGNVFSMPTDVRVLEDLERFVGGALEHFGRMDILVNNAGTSAAMAFDALSDDVLRDDLELKLFAAVRLSRLVVGEMRAAGGGSIVNVLNIGAKAPNKASMPTSISRAAGMVFTKALSRDLGPENIRVNAICIGTVQSGQHRRRAESQGIPLDEYYADPARTANIPLGRVGEAEEFANLVSFLASDEARFITGTAINFDGGAAATL